MKNEDTTASDGRAHDTNTAKPPGGSNYDRARNGSGIEATRVYELTMMNADTPRMTGQHYLDWGAKWGFDSGIEWALRNAPEMLALHDENKRLREALESLLNGIEEYRIDVLEHRNRMAACDLDAVVTEAEQALKASSR